MSSAKSIESMTTALDSLPLFLREHPGRLILGCDPGTTGAFALYHPATGDVLVADIPFGTVRRRMDARHARQAKRKKRKKGRSATTERKVYRLGLLAKFFLRIRSARGRLDLLFEEVVPSRGSPKSCRLCRRPFGQSIYTGVAVGYANGMFPLMLTALGMGERFRHAQPSAWKKAMGLSGKGKDASLSLARKLVKAARPYLTLKKHHNRAEAVLLAHYGAAAPNTPEESEA